MKEPQDLRLMWRAEYDGQTYGSDVILSQNMWHTNPEIEEAFKLLALQATETMQEIVNGKSDAQLKLEELERDLD